MTINRKILNAVWTAAFFTLLCVGPSVFSGCEFYPEELNEKEADTVTVVFDADGGEPATQTLTVAHGEPVGSANMPEEPTKTVSTPGGSVTDGVNEAAAEPTETVYTFGGWYTEKEGGGELFTESMPVEADITVYVKWIRADSGFTVIFDADGGEPNEERKRTIENGKTVGALMPSEPTKDGHIFGGWYTEQDGGGSKFTASTTVSANITVYAKWAQAFTVSFNADGGTPATQTLTVAVGGTVGALPSNPAKAGYIFDGWYTEDDDVVSEFTESTPIEADITVYAKWVSVDSKFTVSFDADGGTPAERPRTVDYRNGRTVGPNMPSDPTKADYTFGGWYTEQNGGGSRFTGSTLVSANIRVYAKWMLDSRTVTFNADGGNPATQTWTVESGGTLGDSMPSGPTKTAYTFGGWYTASGGEGTEFTASTTVSADITVYAKWTINSYTVTFNADGGSPATQTWTVSYESSVGISNMPSNPGKTGHTFDRWYTEIGGGGTEFHAFTPVTADITVYAKWICTVTFNADGGSPGIQKQTVVSGGVVGSMPSNPTKPGYTFDGWYTNYNGGDSQFTTSTPVTADITVYAKWTYIVTFNADGGIPATQTRTVISESSVDPSNMPSDPTKTGHTFGEWYTAIGGGGTEFTASTRVTADITVYAKWTINSYTVTFNADGGDSETQTRTVNYESSVGSSKMPSDPTKTNYTFDGWSTSQNDGGSPFTASTPVTADITVYAKWTIIPPVPSNYNLEAALTWLSDNAVEGGVYTVTLTASEAIGPKTLSYGGKNVSLTIQSETKLTVSLSAVGSLFTVGSGVTLTLNNDVVLSGLTNNKSFPLVKVNSGGTFIMNNGTISSNTSAVSSGVAMGEGGIVIYPSSGGGIHVDGGAFTMKDGTIMNNTADEGGGVYVDNGGTFTMNGGTISGNSASIAGGGVFVGPSGTFTKSGGTIYGDHPLVGLLQNTTSGISNGDFKGCAIYVVGPPIKKRNFTAGPDTILSTSSSSGWQ